MPPAPPCRATFLSTLPARGATFDYESIRAIVEFLSTLPARGATLARELAAQRRKFLSTLPARGATAIVAKDKAGQPISIHAPREGSDWWCNI